MDAAPEHDGDRRPCWRRTENYVHLGDDDQGAMMLSALDVLCEQSSMESLSNQLWILAHPTHHAQLSRFLCQMCDEFRRRSRDLLHAGFLGGKNEDER
jgi:hypothetical protein